jgi:hypothetical protein
MIHTLWQSDGEHLRLAIRAEAGRAFRDVLDAGSR